MAILQRPGDLIAIGNELRYGAVAGPPCNDVDTAAIRALNRKVRDDARVDMVLLPIGDRLPRLRSRGWALPFECCRNHGLMGPARCTTNRASDVAMTESTVWLWGR